MTRTLDPKTRTLAELLRERRALRIGAKALPWVAAVAVAMVVCWPTLRARPPSPIPAAEGDQLFGVPLATRREVFDRYLEAIGGFRANARRAFPDPWSQQDDTMNYLRSYTRSLAARYRLDYTQVYLIFDEGVRKGWHLDNQPPISPMNPPLKPRIK